MFQAKVETEPGGPVRGERRLRRHLHLNSVSHSRIS